MASTITLQNTMNWAQAYLGFAPLNIGTANEPAITSANIIRQTILAPPFKWRWNRNQTTFTTNNLSATQDYPVAVDDFGWLENAYMADAIELQVKDNLSTDTNIDRPAYISPFKDDNAGNIYFRLMPVPPTSPQYTIGLNYQRSAVQFGSLSDTWTPIPDYLQYVYSWGFLSQMYEYFGNPRAASARQAFVGSLLAVSEGLTEQEKDMFYQAWLGKSIGDIRENLTAQLGNRARGV